MIMDNQIESYNSSRFIKKKMISNIYRRAIQLGHELSYVNLIIFLDRQERLTDAEQVATEAMEKFPENPEFMFQYANILGQKVNTL